MSRADPMLPRACRVMSVQPEAHDIVTIGIEAPDGGPASFEPGQFNMLYAFGIGESAISLSGDPGAPLLTHTVRDVGAVTHALAHVEVGETVGVRGPFGSAWPRETARGRDVLIIAGGIGLAPLRPLMLRMLAEREAYERISLLYGVRTPADLIFRDDLEAWSAREDVGVLVTVDAADEHWGGAVGAAPSLLRRATFDPAATTAYVCGPEVMMRFTIRRLREAGVPDERVVLSLERNMACAIGLCGHCQFGPEFVCMDGPVFAYPRIARLLRVPEL